MTNGRQGSPLADVSSYNIKRNGGVRPTWGDECGSIEVSMVKFRTGRNVKGRKVKISTQGYVFSVIW